MMVKRDIKSNPLADNRYRSRCGGPGSGSSEFDFSDVGGAALLERGSHVGS
jgi:hypothetical protein